MRMDQGLTSRFVLDCLRAPRPVCQWLCRREGFPDLLAEEQQDRPLSRGKCGVCANRRSGPRVQRAADRI